MEIGSLEFDEIAYRIDSGLVCGYIQFRAGCLREVWDWVMEHGSLWLIVCSMHCYRHFNCLWISQILRAAGHLDPFGVRGTVDQYHPLQLKHCVLRPIRCRPGLCR